MRAQYVVNIVCISTLTNIAMVRKLEVTSTNLAERESVMCSLQKYNNNNNGALPQLYRKAGFTSFWKAIVSVRVSNVKRPDLKWLVFLHEISRLRSLKGDHGSWL
jgi:hypothetical protein